MKKLFFAFCSVLFLTATASLIMPSCSSSKSAVAKPNDEKTTTSDVYAPDYNQIKKNVEDKNGIYYYSELLRRFEAADTTLTAEQLHHLYYGAATRSDYDPYKSDNFSEVKEALDGDTLTEANWQKAAQAIDEHLKKDPMNLKYHYYKLISYSNLYGRDDERTRNAFAQMDMLFAAISATGDGLTSESAFHVISVSDEYALMNLFGMEMKGQSLISKNGRSYDVMKLRDNKYGVEQLYFDITVCIQSLNKLFGN